MLVVELEPAKWKKGEQATNCDELSKLVQVQFRGANVVLIITVVVVVVVSGLLGISTPSAVDRDGGPAATQSE